MKFYNFKIAFIVLSCVPFGSYATSLQQAARAALTYDSALQSSQMTSEADQQKYWQGMAGMLPTLTLEGNWDRQEQPDKKYQSGVTNHSYDLSVRQPLFDMSKYAGWRKGVAIANTAEAQSKKAEEKLLNAISNAYFSVLYQQEVLQAAKAASHNFKQQQQKLQAGILNGQNTRTELDEAKANYALAQAKEIEASSQLLLAGEAFRRLSGVSPDTVEPVNFQCLNASPYASLTDAINASQQRNTEIKIACFRMIRPMLMYWLQMAHICLSCHFTPDMAKTGAVTITTIIYFMMLFLALTLKVIICSMALTFLFHYSRVAARFHNLMKQPIAVRQRNIPPWKHNAKRLQIHVQHGLVLRMEKR